MAWIFLFPVMISVYYILYLQYYQRAKKVVSNNHGLVDFAFRLVNSVLNPFTQPEWMLESLKVVMTFESVDKILWCDHSNENSLLVLSNGAICFQNFGKPNLRIFFDFCPCSHLALKGLTCPTGKWCFLRNSNWRRIVESIMLVKKLLGLVEVMFGLVNASFSLPEWQAVIMIFCPPQLYTNLWSYKYTQCTL